jgi:ABC-type long-subunit fatty acid transport system fused permease/ATPase subunit
MKLDIDWKHLRKVKSNYFKHFAYATYFNFLALLVFITGVIHSVFPFLFAFTPYKLAKKIVDGTEKHLIKRD